MINNEVPEYIIWQMNQISNTIIMANRVDLEYINSGKGKRS